MYVVSTIYEVINVICSTDTLPAENRNRPIPTPGIIVIQPPILLPSSPNHV